MPDQAKLREYMQRLTARPHHVGSPYDKDNAEWLLAKFKEFGFDAHIESFNVLFPTPKERLIELVDGGPKFTAKLQEPAVPEDPTSDQQSEQLPTYNAYSADGDVTGPLVYVNYGIPEDYETLARHGISVKGAIVIARYGHAWRGIKPKVAAEHGAVGCIIYSDPRDDGYSAGETYPQGGLRPREGVQRGSVQDSTEFMGDPLTPNVGATADAKRLPDQKCPDDDNHSCDSDFIRRCCSATFRDYWSGRSRSVARRIADHVSDRTRSRQSSPQDVFELGDEAAVRRHRENSAVPNFPMNGFCAEIIMTRG